MRTSPDDGTADPIRRWVREWARYWSREWSREWAGYLAQDLAREWGIVQNLPWMEELTAAELFSAVDRSDTRRALAALPQPANPILHLFHAASRASLDNAPNATGLNNALAAFPRDADPLWPALACHIARRSSPEHRALLEDLARHPEKRDPPVSWGLKYYVRGDVLLPDGTEITLDTLCDETGVPRLPYLEEICP